MHRRQITESHQAHPFVDRLVNLESGRLAFAVGLFPVRAIPVTKKLALQRLPKHVAGVIGSALGLVGPVSVYCDSVR